ncbi:hypothetical protein [Haliscomenobacter hydrossis]|uniref:Uncharacterized protein n=1 Tax=Haliscomenobacter hydrossis (strain ATCC 27775 / DSM 1100 / LMG 10767 / O) TaxID=760192 RepID=F4L1F6_HALH1|nr:hypothetical protein [Haliscomenobacter hydrossis]AEE53853.1 hypothetical protein Halhy_6030 [Haliscomenobacter hydrossis DSM 1100]
MKNLYGILLLACLGVPLLGTYAWLQYQKLVVKREVKQALMAGMGKERLVRLAFTPAQADTVLHWEHSREFEYQGQMYDVVEAQMRSDSTIYWCWWDQEETLLNQHLSALVEKILERDPQRQHAQDQLSQFLDNLYCSPSKGQFLTFLPACFQHRHTTPYTYQFYVQSLNTGPPAPPPELVVDKF